jgi:hypothetical protein
MYVWQPQDICHAFQEAEHIFRLAKVYSSMGKVTDVKQAALRVHRLFVSTQALWGYKFDVYC